MKYFLRKFMALLLTMFLVSIFTFAAFNVIPGDPAELILGTEATPESIAALRASLGLNQSLPQRYLKWFGGLLHGNMGTSLQYSQPVSSLLASRLPVTACLAGMAFILIIALSFPAGILAAKWHGSWAGRFLDSITMLNLTLPGFFVGVLFIWIFGIILHCFMPGEYVDYRQNFGGFLRYLIFPAIAVALPNIASTAKFLRTSILAEKGSDYVRTARSKGVSEDVVLRRHILKNAAVPAITLLGMTVAGIFSGSIIVEQVFSLPGVGRLLISAVSSRDFPLLESLVVYIAFLVSIANFLADMLIRAVDPRMKEKA
jgi:peptide/nickel transport system permease protein